jgi:hypothetical protein
LRRKCKLGILFLLLSSLGFAQNETLTQRLLRSAQLGVPQGMTAEQMHAIVENPQSTYLDVMLARSALFEMHRDDDPQWESFDKVLSSVLNSTLNSGNEYPAVYDLSPGFDGKELVFTMVYAMVMAGQEERAIDILEPHLWNGSRLSQAIVLQALRNIGTQRAVGLVQSYQEKGDYHNLAENTLIDNDWPLLSEIYQRWNLVPPGERNRSSLLQIVENGCGEREALAAYWLGYFLPNPDATREKKELSALKKLYENRSPNCDFTARLIAIKSLGLRSPETMDYWAGLLQQEPLEMLRHQILINAFAHFGRSFAPKALGLLATEPSQYIQWQLMQGNIETREGQLFRTYWDMWIPVGLQFMLVFPTPGRHEKMSAADQDDLLHWLEAGHRPHDRVVTNHMIYALMSQTRGQNTRRLLGIFNDLADRNSNWWILVPLDDASALPLLNFYQTLPSPDDQHRELVSTIERLEKKPKNAAKGQPCCEATEACLRTILGEGVDEGDSEEERITSEAKARLWLSGELAPKSKFKIEFSGPLQRAAIVHERHGSDQHWEYIYDCWRRTDVATAVTQP